MALSHFFTTLYLFLDGKREGGTVAEWLKALLLRKELY